MEFTWTPCERAANVVPTAEEAEHFTLCEPRYLVRGDSGMLAGYYYNRDGPPPPEYAHVLTRSAEAALVLAHAGKVTRIALEAKWELRWIRPAPGSARVLAFLPKGPGTSRGNGSIWECTWAGERQEVVTARDRGMLWDADYAGSADRIVMLIEQANKRYLALLERAASGEFVEVDSLAVDASRIACSYPVVMAGHSERAERWFAIVGDRLVAIDGPAPPGDSGGAHATHVDGQQAVTWFDGPDRTFRLAHAGAVDATPAPRPGVLVPALLRIPKDPGSARIPDVFKELVPDAGRRAKIAPLFASRGGRLAGWAKGADIGSPVAQVMFLAQPDGAATQIDDLMGSGIPHPTDERALILNQATSYELDLITLERTLLADKTPRGAYAVVAGREYLLVHTLETAAVRLYRRAPGAEGLGALEAEWPLPDGLVWHSLFFLGTAGFAYNLGTDTYWVAIDVPEDGPATFAAPQRLAFPGERFADRRPPQMVLTQHIGGLGYLVCGGWYFRPPG